MDEHIELPSESLSMRVDVGKLRPLLHQLVLEVLANVPADFQTSHRLAYPEPEAAALIGIPQHSLRDCRLRGEIQGLKIGKRICYMRDELVTFLLSKRIDQ